MIYKLYDYVLCSSAVFLSIALYNVCSVFTTNIYNRSGETGWGGGVLLCNVNKTNTLTKKTWEIQKTYLSKPNVQDK